MEQYNINRTDTIQPVIEGKYFTRTLVRLSRAAGTFRQQCFTVRKNGQVMPVRFCDVTILLLPSGSCHSNPIFVLPQALLFYRFRRYIL